MTSPTPPDLSQLSISPSAKVGRDYDAFNDHNKTFHGFTNASPPLHANLQPQFYNTQASIGQQSARKISRAGLPSQWLDQSPQPSVGENRALSPPHTSDISSGGGSPPPMGYGQQQQSYPQQTASTAQTPLNGMADDDIIPTAIVIKNIPFNVKRETLLDIIASLSIPTPYAFNYHIDTQGVFRGLAFANFRLPQDADAVVAALNGFDVQGRKLRVEYKKVLQAGEKERIEREKAIKRMKSMQLEKERQAMGQQVGSNGIGSQGLDPQTQWDAFGALHSVSPLSSQGMSTNLGGGIGSSLLGGSGMSPPGILGGLPVTSPNRAYGNVGMGMAPQQDVSLGLPGGVPPPQQYPSPPPTGPSKSPSTTELDLNDPSTLEIYSRILVFKEDHMRDELAFSRSLTPQQRRVVHLVAQRLGVYHYSVGEGEDRYAVVTRIERDKAPRGPTRVASQTLSRPPSSFLSPTASSNYAQSPTNATAQQPPRLTASTLRVKKSMPDLNALHSPPSRLQTRSSNGNIREGYATLATPSRRLNLTNPFGPLGSSTTNGGSAIPPVPTLPSLLNGEGSVLRQPRGPGLGGFGARRGTNDAARPSSGAGLDIRSHEPLEL